MITSQPKVPSSQKPVEEVLGATVRLAGDSGDGMQLLGSQLTNTSALAGNDVATFPDFPAEIRAPRGTRAGVSGFQVHFAAEEIYTPGDRLDALVAMNPAALVTNLGDLRDNGILIVNSESFEGKDLKLANLAGDPLADPSIERYRLIRVPMTSLTRNAVAELGLGTKIADRCKNFFAMGLVFWLYGRDLNPTLRFIQEKFGAKAEIAEANRRALMAGWNYGETTESIASTYQVPAAKLAPGKYTNIMGNQAMAWGLIAAARLSGKPLFLGTYPITPASDILHELSGHKHFGVRTFQAEDEISAVCSTIGASFGGAMAVTTTSGPGMALKTEGMGLAVMLELPLLIIDVQRGGPSTGLPTKTEQADLLMACFGRNGESPIPIVAARSPADCFDTAIEAWRMATQFMTPLIILSDGYIANGAEPWRIPDPSALQPIAIRHPAPAEGETPFRPYHRDANLARPWALPGTPGLMHRIGGLEKEDGTGNVSYDPRNHQHMVDTRAQKVANIASVLPPTEVDGPDRGLLVLSWGGTYGACRTAVHASRQRGLDGGARPPAVDPSVSRRSRLDPGPFRSRADPGTQRGPIAFPDSQPLPRRRRWLQQGPGPAVQRAGTGRPDRATRPFGRRCRARFGEPGDPLSRALPHERATMNVELPVLTANDFASDQDVRWCPGCGDYSILAQMKKVLPTLGIPPEKTVFISGIGCSSRFPYYMNTYGIHSIHGRAPAVATGLKATRPDLNVWVITGDGDALSIGGNHLVHCIRRNIDINIVLFNNSIYGLTKGQYSPTSPLGQVTKSTPRGSIDYPLNPLSVALASEATFVARSIDVLAPHLIEVLTRAARHRGTSFVEVYQNCNVFNNGAWDQFTTKDVKDDHVLMLQHGQPMLFGRERNRGIRLNGLTPEVVDVGDRYSVDDLLKHDEQVPDSQFAFTLSRFRYPQFPEPIGVFRAVQRPTYDQLLDEQVRKAEADSGPPQLEDLFSSNDCWTVS